jgi:hypothetical protein
LFIEIKILFTEIVHSQINIVHWLINIDHSHMFGPLHINIVHWNIINIAHRYKNIFHCHINSVPILFILHIYIVHWHVIIVHWHVKYCSYIFYLYNQYIFIKIVYKVFFLKAGLRSCLYLGWVIFNAIDPIFLNINLCFCWMIPS